MEILTIEEIFDEVEHKDFEKDLNKSIKYTHDNGITFKSFKEEVIRYFNVGYQTEEWWVFGFESFCEGFYFNNTGLDEFIKFFYDVK